MKLNFKEIPKSNLNNRLQDSFVLFAHEFLQYLGYHIVSDTNEITCGGTEFIVEEYIQGISSEYRTRWLVSCKHYAHREVPVLYSDEMDIEERLSQNGCDGFMGIYSTYAADSLLCELATIKHSFIFDCEKIEKYLLCDIRGQRIATRYFKQSCSDFQTIRCEICGKDLLEDGNHGMYICATNKHDDLDSGHEKIQDIYFVCKRQCDDSIKRKYPQYDLSKWDDIYEMKNPIVWLAKLKVFIDDMFMYKDLSKDAFEKMKQMFICSYPYVVHRLTSEERKYIRDLKYARLFR